VSNGGMCSSVAQVTVNVHPYPEVNAGPDQTLNLDEPMYLNATGTGTLTWVFGEGILCKDCPYTQIMPKNSSCYRIEAVNQFGCKATDEVCVEVTKDYNVYIPNVFTPNYDGINDMFMVYGTGIEEIEMIIFDRWGEKLYTSTEQLKGWDGVYKGEMSKNDAYVYLINFKTIDGKKHTRTGHVTLMK
jgi:gliding motility-associated-like protein